MCKTCTRLLPHTHSLTAHSSSESRGADEPFFPGEKGKKWINAITFGGDCIRFVSEMRMEKNRMDEENTWEIEASAITMVCLMFNKSTAFDLIFGSICSFAPSSNNSARKEEKSGTYMVPKFAHKTTTANMKRNALFFFSRQNMQTVICLRGITRARISTNIIWFCSAAKQDDRIQNGSFFALSSPLKQTNNWSKKSKIEMHNVLARHKC